MLSKFRVAAVLIVASGVGVVGVPSAAQATRTLAVTPASDLLDGDVVTLHGTGFTPGAAVFFCQTVGVPGSPGPEDCGGPLGSAVADAAGEFVDNYTVQRFMSLSTFGPTIDCAQPSAACTIGASDFFAATSGVAFAPLTFTPQAPRTLTLTPATDLVDGGVVAVHGSGFLPADTVSVCQGTERCLAPTVTIQADAAGEFSLDYTVQRLLTWSGPIRIDCAAPTVPCSMLSGSATAADPVPLTFAPYAPLPQISGTVTDAGGEPVPGADVWAYAPGDSWVGSRQAVTDAQGAFEIAQVEPGVLYRILVRPPAGSPLAAEWWDDRDDRRLARAIALSAVTVAEVHPQLDEAGAITGSVTDGNGNPVPGVQVSAYGRLDTWVGSHIVSTASDGTYRIGGLRPAETGAAYRVLFRPPAGSSLGTEWFDDAGGRTLATEVAVPGGQTLGGVDAELAQTGAISGSVTDAGGNPVPGMQVSAYAPGDILVATHTGSTGADGTYRIDGVRPGAYRVRFAPPFNSGLVPEWFEDATDRAQATDVIVTSGQVTAVDAQLANR